LSEVFELHFKKKIEEDLALDSFCYEPENIYERRLGSLYVVGELKNAFPQNEKLINKIAQVIKAKFYAFPISSFEKSFEESLKAVNDFLTEEVKNDNTSWLGNLNMAVISVKNFEINFTKVGNIKILLLRKGQINDIGERLRFQEIEPYPLKIFSNIAAGEMMEDDQLMVLTGGAFQAFSIESQLVNEIAKIPVEDKSYGRNLKKILKQKEKIFSQISGICLLIILKPELLPKKAFIFEKEVPAFSITEVFKPFVDKVKSFTKVFKKLPYPKTQKKEEKVFHIPVKEKKEIAIKNPFSSFIKKIHRLKNIKLPKIPSFASLMSNKELKKKMVSVLALILLLAFGFLVFRGENQRELKESEATLTKIQEKFDSAKLLIPTDEKKADELLKEAFEEILPFAKEGSPIKDDALKLKEDIEKNLYTLNKLEIIQEPQLFSEIDPKKFIPQKMVVLGKELYFFSPISENLFRINEKGEGTLIPTEQKFNLATTSDNIVLFTKPNTVTPLEQEPFSLILPSPETDFVDLAFFKNNLYFLDAKSGEIIKYPFGESLEGKSYLDLATKKAEEGKSLAVDGSVWVLDKNNEIYRYYAGRYQETLKLDIFPYPKNFKKIFASFAFPYLYILEPEENRVIITTKTGQIVRQFQSEKFDSLKDFAVSENGKVIYLLNGQKIYQISF
jgi:hypothetical protein